MDIQKLRIEKKKLKDIRPADYNPRKKLKTGDIAYERLKASILQYGYIDPLIYNERTDRLVGGHQRYQILTDLGIDEVDVSIVNLDESAEKDLNIRLNRVQGEFDEQALANLLQELVEQDFDLENLGFSDSDYEDLINEIALEDYQADVDIDSAIAMEKGEKKNEKAERPIDSEDSNFVGTIKDENGEEEVNEEDEKFLVSFYLFYMERELLLKALHICKYIYGQEITDDEALVRILETFLTNDDVATVEENL